MPINKFKINKNKLITYDDLKSIPLNEVIIMDDTGLNGHIEYTRISSYTKSLMFTVSMKKGSEWFIHHHDCKETIVVYKGKLIDMLTKKEIVRAETINFNINENHYIKALEDSVFYVEFNK